MAFGLGVTETQHQLVYTGRARYWPTGWGKDRGRAGLKSTWIQVGLSWQCRPVPWMSDRGHAAGLPRELPSWLSGITDWLSPQDRKEWAAGKEQFTKLCPLFFLCQKRERSQSFGSTTKNT